MTDEEYLQRMRRTRPFSYYGIEPKWRERTDIESFIHDEVVRQGHDTENEHDGGQRIRWMLGAWQYAQRAREVAETFTVQDIERIAAHIEPGTNTLGVRTYGIHIGGHAGAPPRLIPTMLAQLVGSQTRAVERSGRTIPMPEEVITSFERQDEVKALEAFNDLRKRIKTVDDWYLLFEFVHPFGDGNGRTGKILHNWLLNSLSAPVLVYDYFGGGNP